MSADTPATETLVSNVAAVPGLASLKTQLADRFGTLPLVFEEFRDNERVIVPAEHLWYVMTYLKSDLGFDMLLDVTCVDYLNYPDAQNRFGVVYPLLNTVTGQRAVVKVYLNEPDLVLPSMVALWGSANWTEREVFDMFGITFTDHPDLRRLLLPNEFVSHPLRKDYPVKGRGERHNFPVVTRAES